MWDWNVCLCVGERDKAVNIFIRNIDMIYKNVMTVNSFIASFFFFTHFHNMILLKYM